jgi:anti-anti-sigma factor
LDIAVDDMAVDGGRIARVQLVGEVDLANADQLTEAFESPACAGADGILLDLRELGFMDSSGLRVVLLAAQERRGRFATILGEGSAVATLFEMVDVGERLNVVASEEEAVARLERGDDAPS